MSKGIKVPEEMRSIAKLARKQGWDIVRQHGGHLCWISPSGKKFFNSATPSCRRGVKNFTALLQRDGGLVIPRG